MSQTISQRNAIYQALAQDGINLHDPDLNVKTAYTDHLHRRIAHLSHNLNQADTQLDKAHRIIASLIVIALLTAVGFAIAGVSHV